MTFQQFQAIRGLIKFSTSNFSASQLVQFARALSDTSPRRLYRTLSPTLSDTFTIGAPSSTQHRHSAAPCDRRSFRRIRLIGGTFEIGKDLDRSSRLANSATGSIGRKCSNIMFVQLFGVNRVSTSSNDLNMAWAVNMTQTVPNTAR